jgi:hypothetical protein
MVQIFNLESLLKGFFESEKKSGRNYPTKPLLGDGTNEKEAGC